MATALNRTVRENGRLGPRPRAFVAQGSDALRPLAANAGQLAFPRSAKCFRSRGVSADMVKRLRNGGEYLAQVLALIDAADMPSAIEAALLARLRARAEDVEGTLAGLREAHRRDVEVEARDHTATDVAIEALLERGDPGPLADAIATTLEDATCEIDKLARMIALANHYATKGGRV